MTARFSLILEKTRGHRPPLETLLGQAPFERAVTMNLGLAGKVVFITGGSKGIGLASARAFAAEGARFSIASRSDENLDRARQGLEKEGLTITALHADLSKPHEAQSAA